MAFPVEGSLEHVSYHQPACQEVHREIFKCIKFSTIGSSFFSPILLLCVPSWTHEHPLSLCTKCFPAQRSWLMAAPGKGQRNAEVGFGLGFLRMNLLFWIVSDFWIASHSLPCTAAIRSVLEWQPARAGGCISDSPGWLHCSPEPPLSTSGYHTGFLAQFWLKFLCRSPGPSPCTLHQSIRKREFAHAGH